MTTIQNYLSGPLCDVLRAEAEIAKIEQMALAAKREAEKHEPKRSNER